MVDTGVKRAQRDSTMAFKLAVVEQVAKGELTCKQAQSKYGIQERPTVLTWMRKHGRQGWGRAASSAAMPIYKTAKPLTPEQQVKSLQVQLAQAQERVKFLETVVDVLKKDYGVRVVKMPAGKSSCKSSSRG